MIAVILIVVGVLVGVAVVVQRSGRRPGKAPHTLRLIFPRDLTAEAVQALFAGIAALAPPLQFPWGSAPRLFLEVVGQEGSIEHRLIVPDSLLDGVQSTLRAALPSARVVEVEPPTTFFAPRLQAQSGIELVLNNGDRALRTDSAPAVCAATLAALQPLRSGETIAVQWILTGTPTPQPVERSADRVTHQAGRFLHLLQFDDRHAGEPSERRDKQATPLLLAAVRIGAVATTISRARHLVRRAEAPLRMADVPGTHLRRRALPERTVVRRLLERSTPALPWPSRFNVAELAALTALPIDGPQLSGLPLGAARQLMPSPDVPRTGCVLGQANFPGTNRPVAVLPDDRRAHTSVLGGTGAGKSSLLTNLIAQDLAFGRGVIVLDPKGDLITDCLDRIPPRRIDEVVLLDPADDDFPVGLNLLADSQRDPELVADQVVHVFHSIFRDSWGPRLDDLLRAALLTLVQEPNMTIVEVPRVLTDDVFRRRLMRHVNDPVGLEPVWAQVDAWTAAERSAALAPVLNKLRTALLRRRVRNTLGQQTPRWNFRETLERGGIVFVSLAKGLLGEESSALMGSLVMSALWNAVQARAAVPEAQRRLTLCYIDELPDFLHIPTSLETMLNQARGLGLGLTVAHQFLSQLPRDARAALLANARTKVSFRVGSDDARVMARELGPQLTPDDLQGLGRFEIVASIFRGAQSLPPVTATTYPPSTGLATAARVRARSREQWAAPRAEVEASIRSRYETSVDEGPIGIRRRKS